MLSVKMPNAAPGRRSVFVLVGIVLVLISQTAYARDKPWFKYESAYFVANSNASKKRTLTVLENLEMFRAAVLPVANLRVPDDAAKTQILIIRSQKDFSKLAGGPNVGGFAMHRNGRFLIVMPSSGPSDWARQDVRHEYSHVLLGYRKFDYPQWYNEGFAELVSTIRFRNKNSEYIFGEAPDSIKYTGINQFDWNALVSDGFDVHSMSAE